MEHPNLTAIEAEREAFFVRLKAAQDGRDCYLQCLLTPAEDQDGNTALAFNRYRRPSDEKEDWSAVLGAADIEGGALGQYWVDRYDGPHGSGFILGCRVVWAGRAWVYQEHHGPEVRGEVFDSWLLEVVVENGK